MFSRQEIDRLLSAARETSPRAFEWAPAPNTRSPVSALFQLLFTTGVRIGAAAALEWRQVLSPSDDAVAPL